MQIKQLRTQLKASGLIDSSKSVINFNGNDQIVLKKGTEQWLIQLDKLDQQKDKLKTFH